MCELCVNTFSYQTKCRKIRMDLTGEIQETIQRLAIYEYTKYIEHLINWVLQNCGIHNFKEQVGNLPKSKSSKSVIMQ